MGLVASMTGFPARLAVPARRNASGAALPLIATTSSSPALAASAKLVIRALGCFAAHSARTSGERVPSVTSWLCSRKPPAKDRATSPDPRIPIFMAFSFRLDEQDIISTTAHRAKFCLIDGVILWLVPGWQSGVYRTIATHDCLPHPPHPVRHSHPDRGEPAHLRAVLRGEHAGRHGAHAARHQTRDTGRHRKMEAAARLRQALAG